MIPLTQQQRNALKDKKFSIGNLCFKNALPWIAPGAIIDLTKILTKDMNVLEYGSGGSTLFFASRVKHVKSYESDIGWYTKMRRVLTNRGIKNVELIFIPSQVELLADIPHLEKNFYHVLLDDIGPTLKGRDREELFLKTIPIMPKDAIYVLDNGQSKHHYFTINDYKLEDYQKLIGTKYTLKVYEMGNGKRMSNTIILKP